MLYFVARVGLVLEFLGRIGLGLGLRIVFGYMSPVNMTFNYLVSMCVCAKCEQKKKLFEFRNRETDPSPTIQSGHVGQSVVIGKVFVGVEHGDLQRQSTELPLTVS